MCCEVWFEDVVSCDNGIDFNRYYGWIIYLMKKYLFLVSVFLLEVVFFGLYLECFYNVEIY